MAKKSTTTMKYTVIYDTTLGKYKSVLIQDLKKVPVQNTIYNTQADAVKRVKELNRKK